MTEARIVSPKEWTAARKALLRQEKELTRQRDRVNQARQALPWVKLEKSYVFEGADGPVGLGDLFEQRSQLIVQHFMLGPGWKDGCVGCSFLADHIDGALVHLEHHDVSFVAVARAPYPEIAAFKQRMGWKFRWVSSYGSDFNYDFNVSFSPEQLAKGKVTYNYETIDASMEEMSGASVFCRDEAGAIFHTYSSYGRGGEEMLGTYMLLDITPKGRNETGPAGNLTDWVRHHDRYDEAGRVDATGRYIAAGM